MSTFYLQTWGCQMNVYDSGRLRDLMTSRGHAETDDVAAADAVILITCAVREKPREKVISQLFAWLSENRYKPGAVVCVGGCVAALEGEALLKRAPMVRVVFGPQTIHRVPDMIEEARRSGARLADVSFPAGEKFGFLPFPNPRGRASAFVTVMEGCSNFCSYCVVPRARGPEFSRSPESVLAEIAGLAAAGVKEICLIGQNVNSYRGAGSDGRTVNFAELLYRAAEEPGVERIRFTTSNPQDFTDELARAYADLPQLAGAAHIPAQSGSNRILKAMNRRYTRERYIEVAEKLGAARPGISITTDFIVGFPGETEEDFAQTMDLVETVGFDRSFSFVFSPRPGTPAAAMADPTPLTVKKERLYRLQAALESLALHRSRAMFGTVQRTLAEGPAEKEPGMLRGRADCGRTVIFKGDPALAGTFVSVRVTGVAGHTLRGETI